MIQSKNRFLSFKEIKAQTSKEIKDLRTEIHHVGNNINQIVRSVNAGIANAEDARRGLYLLEQVYELVHETDFPALKIGSRIVVQKESFIRWAEQNTGGAA